jgi:hypothetical protein
MSYVCVIEKEIVMFVKCLIEKAIGSSPALVGEAGFSDFG